MRSSRSANGHAVHSLIDDRSHGFPFWQSHLADVPLLQLYMDPVADVMDPVAGGGVTPRSNNIALQHHRDYSHEILQL